MHNNNRIIDCGDGYAIKLNTRSPATVTIVTEPPYLGAGIKMNFSQTRELLDHLQHWIDDNPDHESCEINEDSDADNLLHGN